MTQEYNKLPGDGDPWAPNNVLENLEQKKTPLETRWAKQQTRRSTICPNIQLQVLILHGNELLFPFIGSLITNLIRSGFLMLNHSS